MNKDNFQKVITAIEENGIALFNMAAFIGHKRTEECHYDGEYPMFAHEYVVTSYSFKDIQMASTKMFDCDTVGCIAGFAVAVQNDWKFPSWLKDANDEYSVNRQMAEGFTKEACIFLGLTQMEGENLFYNGETCIWKWLVVHEAENYSNLRITEEFGCDVTDYYINSVAQIDGIEWGDDQYRVNFSSIDWKTAADVLTRIMNEEFILANRIGEPDFGPNYRVRETM